MIEYFKFREFFRQGVARLVAPLKIVDVCQKIKDNHLDNLNSVRRVVKHPVYVTSGYRPVFWERLMGRNGKSQHTFKGLGAVDVSTDPAFIPILREALINNSDYARICYYPKENFFHCDHKSPAVGVRVFYVFNYDTRNFNLDHVIK